VTPSWVQIPGKPNSDIFWILWAAWAAWAAWASGRVDGDWEEAWGSEEIPTASFLNGSEALDVQGSMEPSSGSEEERFCNRFPPPVQSLQQMYKKHIKASKCSKCKGKIAG
jgi:hypothetical protein